MPFPIMFVAANEARLQKRPEILKAAAKVFRIKGYHATRIQDIADALGMQKGSLYYYISTKEDLLKGLVEEILEQSVELLGQHS